MDVYFNAGENLFAEKYERPMRPTRGIKKENNKKRVSEKSRKC